MGKPPKEPSKFRLVLFEWGGRCADQHLVDGAKIPVKLGFGDISGTTGRYWANPGISDKGDGQVMAW